MKGRNLIVEMLLNKPFTLKNTIPASKLREISQRKLLEMLEENHVLGLIVKDEMAITMMGMEEFEELKEYVESLEQELEELQMVKNLGEDYFKKPREEFIKIPDGMSIKEYNEWRKGMRR